MSSFIDVRIEGEGAKEVLAVARREAKAKLKEAMASAAEKTVLPEVRAKAPAVVREALVVKGAVKGPKITTAGPRKFDRITGLLNYGGTVRTVIAPKQADGHQALVIGSGTVIRARVKRPRSVTGKHFVERGVEAGFADFTDRVLPEVMTVFNGLDHAP